jgi:signal transduction histidine kinase
MAVQAEPGVSAPVDRARLSEAIGHLIDNAAKFSPPGAPISVSVRAERGEALIEIADGGPGIPPERREAVFERYSMWRPPGYEDTPGAGLGLFIARAHVLAHGGRLEIEGLPAGGTMLRVRVPAGG